MTKPSLSQKQRFSVSSQKEGENGVFWAGEARPKHSTSRFIEKTRFSPDSLFLFFLFIFLLISYMYVLPRWADPNQDSRLKMVVAVVEDGTFQIDKYLGTTVDYAKVDGHYYSDKAPGVAFLGIPIYAVLRSTFDTPLVAGLIRRLETSPSFQATLNPEGSGVNENKIHFALAQVVIALFAGTIPTAILGVLIFRWLALITPNIWPRLLLALAYGLLTPAYAYANTIYGHQLSAALLFGAFYLVSTAHKGLSPWVLLAVGGLLGYSVVTEYPTAVMVVILFLYTCYRLFRNGQWKHIFWVAASATPIALGWMLYNQTIFGGPLNLGYSYSELWVDQHSSGFMSLSLPHAGALWGITFGLFRGLFVLSPWLLFGVVGFVYWWRKRYLRIEWCVALACILSMYLFNASSGMWWGGFASGRRYLLPGLPFLVLPIGFMVVHWQSRRWLQVTFAILLAWSAVAVWGLTWAGQSFPSDVLQNPLFEYALPNWQQGNIARNLGTLLSLKGWQSLLPLFLIWSLLTATWGWLLRRQKPSTAVENPYEV